MDRNLSFPNSIRRCLMSLSARRAWIEIGLALRQLQFALSLSARRAWIEIVVLKAPEKPCQVALRKESVDRNLRNRRNKNILLTSLSARRAWIEIAGSLDDILAGVVALRKESVDRNPYLLWQFGRAFCRSPQGERG